jgi:hypothetical protein
MLIWLQAGLGVAQGTLDLNQLVIRPTDPTDPKNHHRGGENHRRLW